MPENKFSISVVGLVISCALSLLAGIGGMAMYYNPPAAHQPPHEVSHDEWIKLSVDSTGDVLTYSEDALFRSDIKLPPVLSVSGKSKFVADMAERKSQTKLGYVIDVDIAPLDVSKVPDSYRAVDPSNPANKKPPITAVDYDVVFYFILKDKDGFPLMKAASNAETVHSGTNNHFQLFAKTYIPQAVASNTKIITIRMEAAKCLTCSHDEISPPVKHKRHSLFNF